MLWRNVTETRDSANERGGRRTLPSCGGFVRVMETASWFMPSVFSFPGDDDIRCLQQTTGLDGEHTDNTVT